ncbi:MAG: hypothetical protein RL199_543, partial [Pseudomonadota bacterium]
TFAVVPSGAAFCVLSATSVTTGADGIATVSADASLAAGSYVVEASAAGAPVVSFAMTNLAGEPASLSVVSGDAQRATVAASYAQPLVVEVVDAFDNLVPDAAVSFVGSPSAYVTLSGATAVTDASGRASVTAIAGTKAGAFGVVASSGAASTVQFSLSNVPGPAVALSFTAGADQSAVVGAFLDDLVVRVADAFDNSVPDLDVYLAVPSAEPTANLFLNPSRTDASGLASFSLIAGAKSGSFRVTALVRTGVRPSSATTLTNLPGAPAKLESVGAPSPSSVVGSSQDFSFRLLDDQDNPVPGRNVSFVVTGCTASASATLDAPTVETSAAGMATVRATAGRKAGTCLVSATVTGAAQPSAEIPWALAGGAPAAVSVVEGAGQSAMVGTPFAAPLVVAVTDLDGNPVAGAQPEVQLSAAGPGASLSAPVEQTDASGRAALRLGANRQAGEFSVVVRVGTLPVAKATLTNLPGPAARLVVESGSGQSVVVGTTGAVPVVGRVVDADGNGVGGVGVAAEVRAADGTLSSRSESSSASDGRVSLAVGVGSKPGPFDGLLVATEASLESASFVVTAVSGEVAARELVIPPVAVVGDELPVTVRLENRSSGPLPALRFAFYLLRTPSVVEDEPFDAVDVPGTSLPAAGATGSIALRLQLPTTLAAGRHPVSVIIDQRRVLKESASTMFDNLRASLTDLEVKAESADFRALDVVWPSSAVAGEEVPVRCILENHGKASGELEAVFVLSSNATVSSADVEVGRVRWVLAKDERRVATAWVRLPADLEAGNYRIGLRLDPDDRTDEVDEDDNDAVSSPAAVAGAAFGIATTTLPVAVAGQPYATVLAGQGGVEGAWLAAGALPDGLTLSSDGLLSGIPTLAGAFDLLVSLTRGSFVSHRTYVLRVVQATLPLEVSTGALSPARVGIAFSASLAASGGVPPYTWSFAAPVADGYGLTLTADGLLSATPKAAAEADLAVRVADALGNVAERRLAYRAVVKADLSFPTPLLPDANVGVPYEFELEASGGAVPYGWSVDGALPPGLSLEHDGAGRTVLRGTPTRGGDVSFALLLTDATGDAVRQRCRLRIVASSLTVLTDDLPSIVRGDPYDAEIVTDGESPAFRLAEGRLPDGFTLTADGHVGTDGEAVSTALAAGSYTFLIEVTDMHGATARQGYTLVVDPVGTGTSEPSSGCAQAGLGLLGLAGLLVRRRRPSGAVLALLLFAAGGAASANDSYVVRTLPAPYEPLTSVFVDDVTLRVRGSGAMLLRNGDGSDVTDDPNSGSGWSSVALGTLVPGEWTQCAWVAGAGHAAPPSLGCGFASAGAAGLDRFLLQQRTQAFAAGEELELSYCLMGVVAGQQAKVSLVSLAGETLGYARTVTLTPGRFECVEAESFSAPAAGPGRLVVAFGDARAAVKPVRLSGYGDDVAAAVELPFAFPFGGQARTSWNVGSNGMAAFNDRATAYSNTSLPDAGAPLGLLAPWWDDLKLPSEPNEWTSGTGAVLETVGGTTSLVCDVHDFGEQNKAGKWLPADVVGALVNIVDPSTSTRYIARISAVVVDPYEWFDTIAIVSADGSPLPSGKLTGVDFAVYVQRGFGKLNPEADLRTVRLDTDTTLLSFGLPGDLVETDGPDGVETWRIVKSDLLGTGWVLEGLDGEPVSMTAREGVSFRVRPTTPPNAGLFTAPVVRDGPAWAVEWRRFADYGESTAVKTFRLVVTAGGEFFFEYDPSVGGRGSSGSATVGMQAFDGTWGLAVLDCSPDCSMDDYFDALAGKRVGFYQRPELGIGMIEGAALAWPGRPLSAAVTVVNSGNRPAADVEVSVYLSSDDRLDEGDRLLSAFAVGNLDAGAERRLVLDATLDEQWPEGVSRLLVVVDGGGRVSEIDEGDNVAVRPLLVEGPTADCRVASVSFANLIESGVAAPGDAVDVVARLRNDGTASARCGYRWMLSENSHVSLADVAFSAADDGSLLLDPGQEASVPVSLTLPAGLPSGRWFVGLVVDPDGLVAEMDDFDNAAATPWPLTVSGPLSVAGGALPQAAVGVAYEVRLRAEGGASALVWSLADPAPAGLSLSSGGLLSGVPTQTGEFVLRTVTVAGVERIEATWTLTVSSRPPTLHLISTDLPSGVVLRPYSERLAAAGGRAPYSFAVDVAVGRPPSGLGLAADGTVEGTPELAGTFSLPVVVTDADGAKAWGAVRIVVGEPAAPTVKSVRLPDATVSVSYSARLEVVGGKPSYAWRLDSVQRTLDGAGPSETLTEIPGITVLSTGVVSGKPSLLGRYALAVTVTDGGGAAVHAAVILEVTTSQRLAVLIDDLPAATVGVEYRERLVAAGGEGAVSFSMDGAGTLPTGLTLDGDGLVRGTPTAAGLTTFVVRAADSVGRLAWHAVSLKVSEAPAAASAGCAQADGAFWGTLLAAALGLRRRLRRRALRSAAVALSVLGLAVLAGGCAPAKTSSDPCSGVICQPGETCDAASGSCRCGERACTRYESCNPNLLACEPLDRCLTVACGHGMSCDPADGTCRCGTGAACADGEWCAASTGECVRSNLCEGVVCNGGALCDPASGLCRCGDVSCESGQRCEAGRCVADPCLGVHCTGGTSCDPVDGRCRCGLGGPVCGPTESCTVAEKRCEPSNRCAGVSCPVGAGCDPLDGRCHCGGSAGPVCLSGQTCDPVRAACFGGTFCQTADACPAGTTCDPETGACRCGAGGPVCPVGQGCDTSGKTPTCRVPCDPASQQPCLPSEACMLVDIDTGASWCARAGTKQSGSYDCSPTAPCARGLYCLEDTYGTSCVEFCTDYGQECGDYGYEECTRIPGLSVGVCIY